jgi:hypothetical protein
MKFAPSLRVHKALLDHDQRHGDPRPRLGVVFHWGRSWLWQKTRQWEGFDAIVCGANPILGALAAAGLAKQGQRVLWAWSDEKDDWDYPLALAGESDGAFQAAGLPPMGLAWFRELARVSDGQVTMARGWSVAYASPGADAASHLAFLEPKPARRWGASREQASRWAAQAFESAPRLVVRAKPARHGGGPRQPVAGHARLIRVSDALDGAPRAQGSALGGHALADRLGRARWHSQTPWDFLERSREDLALALAWGGWK